MLAGYVSTKIELKSTAGRKRCLSRTLYEECFQYSFKTKRTKRISVVVIVAGVFLPSVFTPRPFRRPGSPRIGVTLTSVKDIEIKGYRMVLASICEHKYVLCELELDHSSAVVTNDASPSTRQTSTLGHFVIISLVFLESFRSWI